MSRINPDPLKEFTLKVIAGLDSGNIRSKPLLDMSSIHAESWPMVALRTLAVEALSAAGYTIRTGQQKPTPIARPKRVVKGGKR